MRVAAVVVTYNRKLLLRKCVQALLDQERPLEKIIVIDNASEDGTDRLMCKEFPQIAYVRMTENTGGAGGFSKGMELAFSEGFDWIWVMDDDALPLHNALAELLNNRPNDKSLYALACAVIDSKGNICCNHRRRIDPVSITEEPIEEKCYKSKSFEVDTATFVGLLVSKEIVHKIGFPRKDYFIYFDDTEYSLRIRHHGGKILTVPTSLIVHDDIGIMDTSERTMLSVYKQYYGRRNQLYTYRRYFRTNLIFYSRFLWQNLHKQFLISRLPQRLLLTKMLWLGTFDGLRGKLGKRDWPIQY